MEAASALDDTFGALLSLTLRFTALVYGVDLTPRARVRLLLILVYAVS
jgi:hypothetical protein